MTYQRCIMCKQLEDKKEIMRQFYCKNCGDKGSINKFDHYFTSFSWELFQLEHPFPGADCYGIRETSDKKFLYNTGKEKLEALLVSKNELKKFYEEENNTSNEFYKDIAEDVKRIQDQFTRILYYKPKD